jgi:hypothetical protein
MITCVCLLLVLVGAYAHGNAVATQSMMAEYKPHFMNNLTHGENIGGCLLAETGIGVANGLTLYSVSTLVVPSMNPPLFTGVKCGVRILLDGAKGHEKGPDGAVPKVCLQELGVLKAAFGKAFSYSLVTNVPPVAGFKLTPYVRASDSFDHSAPPRGGSNGSTLEISGALVVGMDYAARGSSGSVTEVGCCALVSCMDSNAVSVCVVIVAPSPTFWLILVTLRRSALDVCSPIFLCFL